MRMGRSRVRVLPRPRPEARRSGAPTLIRDPANLAAAAADQICLTCHLNRPTQIGRLESSHARNQISCTARHKVHASEPRCSSPTVAVP